MSANLTGEVADEVSVRGAILVAAGTPFRGAGKVIKTLATTNFSNVTSDDSRPVLKATGTSPVTIAKATTLALTEGEWFLPLTGFTADAAVWVYLKAPLKVTP